MTLYVDSSALVKRYVAEDGSDEMRAAMEEAAKWSSCRHGFVETVRAVGLRAGDVGVRRVRGDWLNCHVIELDRELAEQAAQLALSRRLRTLDALHLAAAMTLPTESVIFATWDVRLHRAACKQGLRILPATLN